MPRRKKVVEGVEPNSLVDNVDKENTVATETVKVEPEVEPENHVILQPLNPEPETEHVSEPAPEFEVSPNNHYKGGGKTYEPNDVKNSMMDKLQGKIDVPVEDPFSQSGHLEKEIKGVSEREGFVLTRGKEAGARLMARRQQRFGRE